MKNRTVRIKVLLTTCGLILSVPFGDEFKAQIMAAEPVLLENFNDVLSYIDKDNISIKVKPGTYNLPDSIPDADPLLSFTGNNSVYDFTGVTLVVERNCDTVFGLIGEHIVFEGLTLKMLPGTNRKSSLGPLGINIIGSDSILRNVTVHAGNSSPYGYGSLFGIGSGATAKLYKGTGIRIGPANNTRLSGCRVVMRAFGHGIFLRGAQDTVIEDTVVEGELRQTDDILAETSGTAFDQGFMDADGQTIRPGRITSLQEDGIRIYTDSGTSRNYTGANGRKTGTVTLNNCTVIRMRRGICLALGGSRHVVNNCEVRECAREGYNIGTETTIRNSRGDAKYSPVLEIANDGTRNCDIELTVLDSRDRQGNSFGNDPDILANIQGTGHRIVLQPQSSDAVPADMTIELGGAVGRSSESTNVLGNKITLINQTPAWVLLHPKATNCTVTSTGRTVDYGNNKYNTVN